MILGYQVQDQQGNHWANRPSFEILTEQTALKELMESRNNSASACWNIIAITEGDIEEPTFENHLAATLDQYKAIGVSSAHLTLDDYNALEILGHDEDCGMVMGRDTGWLIKLYDMPENNLGYEGMSDTFHKILVDAVEAGYRLVEFDTSAAVHDEFKVMQSE